MSMPSQISRLARLPWVLRSIEPNAARRVDLRQGRTEPGAGPVNRNTAERYRNPTEVRKDHDARRDQFQRETVLPLGTALILIVLSSVGLWWAILSGSSAIRVGVTGVGSA